MTGSPGGQQLRIAVLGDFDSVHTRRYLRFFVERGHDVHAVSFYKPRTELAGVTLHTLRSGAAPSAGASAGAATLRSRVQELAPPTLMRLVHAMRYQRAGLGRVLRQIEPDVFHAHYVVEHGFYGALSGVRPLVVTAWGSDLLRESYTPLGRMLARWVLRRADLVTGNDPSLVRRVVELGVEPEKTALVRVGVDALFLQAKSVNLDPTAGSPPTVISDRALEPLYNVETVVRSFAALHQRLPALRLLIAGDGSQRARLERLARELGSGESVRFLGRLEPEALRDALASAHVYVSVPTTDSMAVSSLEAMAVGAFPVISDLASVDGWVEPGINGLLVSPAAGAEALANALADALSDPDRRSRATSFNRARVEAEGMNERNMLLLERLYYKLAGHPVSGDGVI